MSTRLAKPGLAPHLFAAVVTLAFGGCDPGNIVPGGQSVNGGRGATAGTGGAAAGSSAAGEGGGSVVYPEPTEPSLLPVRVRRLTNFELDRALAPILGTNPGLAAKLPADFRQHDFTPNVAQQVDAVFAAQYGAALAELAAASAPRIVAGAGCAASQGETCARKVATDLGKRAYRRLLTGDEIDGLVTVFRAGADGASFADGVGLMVEAMLVSPNFLYVTELGEGAAKNGVVTLAPYEIASALSFSITGAPPDDELIAAAPKLAASAERQAQAQRLLAKPDARAQVQRLIKEWLGIDRIEATGKNKSVYPKFEELRPQMASEADAFIAAVAFDDDGTVGKLLTADYTIADGTLGQFYGLGAATTANRRPFTSASRRGILTQAAFLSVHAHDHESAPVKRGATVLKRVLCSPMPQPGELNIMIVPPPPDPAKTTRERFTQHATDAACAACHRQIDPIGFSFEGFDGMGEFRTTENGKPVDSRATITSEGVQGEVADAAAFVAKLAASDRTKECFARQLFRFGAAQAGEGYEQKFLDDVWTKLPMDSRDRIASLLVAFAASDLFVQRRVP